MIRIQMNHIKKNRFNKKKYEVKLTKEQINNIMTNNGKSNLVI